MGNIITSGAAVFKSGTGVATTIPEEAWTTWISGAEAILNSSTRHNWCDDYATLNDDVKFIIADTVENLVAINAITYDMSGYASRGEAESMITVLRDGVLRNLGFLRDKKTEDFINGA